MALKVNTAGLDDAEKQIPRYAWGDDKWMSMCAGLCVGTALFEFRNTAPAVCPISISAQLYFSILAATHAGV
jgi:hypothetical protein